MTLLEFAVCGERPVVFEYEGRYFILFRRCIHHVTEEGMEFPSTFLAASAEGATKENIETPKNDLPEWKLPEDPFSRVIEYFGKPVRFSSIRFAIMRLLISTESGSASFSEIAKAAWGEYIDKATIEKQAYPLNLFLRSEGIPWEVRCSKERMYLEHCLIGTNRAR